MNTQKITNKMNNNVQNKKFALSKSRYLELVKEFKDSLKKKENMPYKDEHGTKYKVITLVNFMFYAMLRGKNPISGVKSTDSFAYREAKNVLTILKNRGGCYAGCLSYTKALNLVQITFPSITEDEVSTILNEQKCK